ncbi:MAG: glycosyltransferase [Candidatus Electrothrix sp. AR4]|nr:glycosyltransferase [Candidatus Electrothrix sp. AR4]
METDLALTRRSLLELDGLVELTSLEQAEVIHSVWEEPLFDLDQNMLAGKRVVCHVCNNLMRLHENSCMIKAGNTVGLWIAMAQEAVRDLQALHYPHAFIPYSVDTEVFQPLHLDGISKRELRNRYQIPESAFLISNFMRDSLGHDLALPKQQKGVELFLEIGIGLKKNNIPVHFLLAGPRRHWIRNKLREYSVPFTFVGNETERDDSARNIIAADGIRELYCASDLHLVTSRWEGGPRSVLEAAATKTPILSTPVGVAPDILSNKSLYTSIDEAVDQAKKHYESEWLDSTLVQQYKNILEKHTPESNVSFFNELYRDIDTVEPYSVSKRWVNKSVASVPLKKKITGRVRRFFAGSVVEKSLCISLWHEFHKPPYGGGNQFMLALQSAMNGMGVRTVTNKLSSSVDVHICNSCWFDYKKFQKKSGSFPVRMIHRIDGPITLYRGEGRAEDEKIFELNQQLASATVFQSAYSFKESYELGFRAVSPVIIHNSVNSAIFNAEAKRPFAGQGKIRLVSSAWSDNPRKGGAFLKWLDEHLDWDRFEYTFIGRVQEDFKHIKHILPVPSEELAAHLRKHDIYISVSLHEPCSNALLEALACGLPALYRNDGGNPELVSFGGLPFNGEEDVLSKLDRLAKNVISFQRVIQLRSIEDIAARYIALADRICEWEQVGAAS